MHAKCMYTATPEAASVTQKWTGNGINSEQQFFYLAFVKIIHKNYTSSSPTYYL